MGIARCKSIRSGIGHREIHFRCFGSAEVAIGTGVLHFVEGVAEHLILRVITVEEEINGFSDLLILDLTLKIFIYDLFSLL